MNLLYIIGNGLDIAFGLKTSYQDFFTHYLALPVVDKDIAAMKKDIASQRYETWADLEMGLGAYSEKCYPKDIFLKCINDIKSSLKKYLINESKKINSLKIASRKHFFEPQLCLEPEPRNRYTAYLSRYSQVVDISVISFNYTSTLEKLIDSNPYNKNITLRSINHVHGLLDDMMVMGVNDSSQIKNLLYNDDLDIVEEFVKPEYNDACMNDKNSACESLVKSADVLVLYGTSLGPSDNKWWKLIGEMMSSDSSPMIVYLPHDDNKDLVSTPNHLRRWTRGYVHEIHEKFEIKIDEETLSNRICVGLNQDLFTVVQSNPKLISTK